MIEAPGTVRRCSHTHAVTFVVAAVTAATLFEVKPLDVV